MSKKEFVGILQDPDTDYCELETLLEEFIAYAKQYGPVYVKEVNGYTFYSNCPITDEMINSAKGGLI